MRNLAGIVEQMKKERDAVQKQLSALNAAIAAFVGSYSASGKPTLSAAARRKISLAQKARWARVKAGKASATPSTRKRVLSAAARRKIAQAQKARWARVKAQTKSAT